MFYIRPNFFKKASFFRCLAALVGKDREIFWKLSLYILDLSAENNLSGQNMDLRGLGQAAAINAKIYCPDPANLGQSRFIGLEARAIGLKNLGGIVPHSNFRMPIVKETNQLAGYARGPGQASAEVQRQVMQKIAEYSSHLKIEDQALLLSIAKLESGFNPDAAAITSSASGVFQLIERTAANLGLSQSKIFNADLNIQAGIKLFDQNLALIKDKYSMLSGTDRSVILYALHHDGPSLGYGGEQIAKQRILPELSKFRLALEKDSYCYRAP